MSAVLERLRDRVDRLTLRERVLVLAASLVVVAGLWEALLAAPLDARESIAAERIEAARMETERLDRAIEAAAHGISEGMPDQTERVRVLQSRVAANDDALRGLASDLVDPAQMRDVLEELLLARPGLDLLRMRNMPAEPMFETDGAARPEPGSGAEPGLYRHVVVIELEGTYLDALAYVREIERLPWQLYWPGLEIEMDDYPRARIVIELGTLSLDEEWIGV